MRVARTSDDARTGADLELARTPPPVRRPLLVRLLWALVPPGLLAAGSMLFAAVLYRPWGDRISLPLSDGFDLQLHALFIRNLYTTGDYAHTNQLGAPFGQSLLDFPISGDRVHFWFFQLIGLFTRNPYTALSLYFLLGFGLVAVATYAVMRELRLDRHLAAVVTILFTFLPYHFWHDEKHVFLAAYFPVPLGFLMAVWALRGSLPIPWIVVPRGEWSREDRRRLVILVVCILVGASSDSYYAMFAVFLVAAAGFLGAVGSRSWRSLFAAGGVVAALLVVTLLNNLREILWRAHHGVDHYVSQRPTADSERYALHLAQALLPQQGHRIGGLSNLGKQARVVAAPGEGGTYLGVIAVVGLVASVGWLLVHGVRRRPDRPNDTHAPDGEMPTPIVAGGLALSVILVSTVGGLGFVLALVGFSQIRSWGRFVLDLALAGLLGAAWLVQELLKRAGARRKLVTALVLPALVAVGLFDQIPRHLAPAYASEQRTIESERAFVTSMEQLLPRDAMVFQFPLTTFPEAGPIVALPDYSLFMPYLLGSGKLRYSYGGLRGRASDWQIGWANHPTMQTVRGLALVGFDALYVDRRGYIDEGKDLDTSLRPLVGGPVLQSADGNQRLYDLRSLRRRFDQVLPPTVVTGIRKLILHSVLPRFGRGVGRNAGLDTSVKRWLAPHSRIDLQNPLDTPRQVELRIQITSPTDSHVTVEVAGQRQTRRIKRTAAVFTFQVKLSPGDTPVLVATDARQVPNPASTEDQRLLLTGLVVDDKLVQEWTRDR